MPKLGMQPIRSTALIEAVITEIGKSGTMDVTVSQIARRAGMSSALAHHYFGSKNKMFVAAMRHIMTKFGQEVRENLSGKSDAQERLEIVIRTSFSEENLHPDTVSAWLNFYVFAQKSGEVARLLRVYHNRLETNLRHELRRLVPGKEAMVAEGIAAIIDGAYVRWVLRGKTDFLEHPEDIALDYLHMSLKTYGLLKEH